MVLTVEKGVGIRIPSPRGICKCVRALRTIPGVF